MIDADKTNADLAEVLKDGSWISVSHDVDKGYRAFTQSEQGWGETPIEALQELARKELKKRE